MAIGRRRLWLTIGSLFPEPGRVRLVRAVAVGQISDGGFFGWHIYAPFDTSEVKTVAVFFKTQSFRRDVEKQLTEAVDQGDHLRTPYKVVGDHEKADSLLTGTITSADKNLVVEAPTNFARELNMTINVAGEMDS